LVKTLNDVPPDKAFWFCNGTCAPNIYQFVDTLEHNGDDVFMYHITGEKNDFANWIMSVLEDEVLYHSIKNEREKHWFVQKVRKRIKDIEEQEQQIILRK